MTDRTETEIQVLRKGSYRFVGPLLLAGVLAAGWRAHATGAGAPAYVVLALLAMLGLWYLVTDSRYVLAIDGADLIWSERNGRARLEGRVPIRDIRRLDAYRVKINPNTPNRPAKRLAVVLTLRDGSRVRLSKNLNLGGAGNPRYEDVLEAVRRVNPSIASEHGTVFRSDIKDLPLST